jgi:hypothetical protein
MMKTAIAISPMMKNILSVATIPPAAVTASQMEKSLRGVTARIPGNAASSVAMRASKSAAPTGLRALPGWSEAAGAEAAGAEAGIHRPGNDVSGVISGGACLPPPPPGRPSRSGVPAERHPVRRDYRAALRGVSETVFVVAETPEAEGCNGWK